MGVGASISFKLTTFIQFLVAISMLAERSCNPSPILTINGRCVQFIFTLDADADAGEVCDCDGTKTKF